MASLIAHAYRLVCVTTLLMGCSAVSSFAQQKLIPEVNVPAQISGPAMILVKLCRSDYDRLCSNVMLGGGRALSCLQRHAAQLNAPCAKAVTDASALKK